MQVKFTIKWINGDVDADLSQREVQAIIAGLGCVWRDSSIYLGNSLAGRVYRDPPNDYPAKGV